MERGIAIIGAGKVGTAIGWLLRKKGFAIASIACRTEESLQKALPYTGGTATTNAVKAANLADIIFLTTNDDQIENVCFQIAQGGGFKKGDAVFHMSGAHSIDVLKSAREAGAEVGSIHPLQSFADVDGAIKNLPGSVFGLTVEEPLLPLVRQIVSALDGEMVLIKDGDRSIYHAGACVACNYLVSLIHFGQRFYQALGISEDLALKAFWPLIMGTLANIERKSTAAALTGPIARGDLGTLKKHLSALDARLPELAHLYRELAKYTVKVAREKGTINLKQEELLNELLSEDR